MTFGRRASGPGGRTTLVVAVVAAVVTMIPAGAEPQDTAIQRSRFAHAPMIAPPAAGELEILPVRDNVYVIVGAGGNITASVGLDGVLLVDTGTRAMAEKVLEAVNRLQREVSRRAGSSAPVWGAETRSSIADRYIPPPSKPIRYIINTHLHADHVGGNEVLRNAGRTFTGGNVAGDIRDSGEGAAILAHENVLTRMARGAEGQAAPPADALPTDTYYVDSYKLSHFFNGEGVQLVHVPRAHTDGDSIVVFRRSDVIALGGLMSTASYPVIDVARGGHINGIIEGLNAVLDLAFPEFRLEGGTMMVPGHGRIVDSGDVAYYRDMLTIIRDRVQGMVKKGMTLDAVKAARPAADYDPAYGTSAGWTSDMFVEALYANLGGGAAPAAPARRR